MNEEEFNIQCEKALALIIELIELNPQLNRKVWPKALYMIIAIGVRNQINYQKFKEKMNNICEDHKYLWEE